MVKLMAFFIDFHCSCVLFQLGIDADLYVLPKDSFGGKKKENQCFNADDYTADDGLQNISPCQYGELKDIH